MTDERKEALRHLAHIYGDAAGLVILELLRDVERVEQRAAEGPARVALRRLVAAVRHDCSDYGGNILTDSDALIEAEAVLSGRAASREVVGYRVRWTEAFGGRNQDAWRVGKREGYDVDDCKRRSEEKARALAMRGCTFVVVTAIVRIRKGAV